MAEFRISQSSVPLRLWAFELAGFGRASGASFRDDFSRRAARVQLQVDYRGRSQLHRAGCGHLPRYIYQLGDLRVSGTCNYCSGTRSWRARFGIWGLRWTVPRISRANGTLVPRRARVALHGTRPLPRPKWSALRCSVSTIPGCAAFKPSANRGRQSLQIR